MPGLPRRPASLNTVKQRNPEPLDPAPERGATKHTASRAKLNLYNTRRRVQTRCAAVFPTTSRSASSASPCTQLARLPARRPRERRGLCSRGACSRRGLRPRAAFGPSPPTGMRIEQARPSAVAARKMFSTTHHIDESGLSELTESGFMRPGVDLKKGSMTYGALNSIVYWRGIAAAYIFCCGVPSVSVFF